MLCDRDTKNTCKNSASDHRLNSTLLFFVNGLQVLGLDCRILSAKGFRRTSDAVQGEKVPDVIFCTSHQMPYCLALG